MRLLQSTDMVREERYGVIPASANIAVCRSRSGVDNRPRASLVTAGSTRDNRKHGREFPMHINTRYSCFQAENFNFPSHTATEVLILLSIKRTSNIIASHAADESFPQGRSTATYIPLKRANTLQYNAIQSISQRKTTHDE